MATISTQQKKVQTLQKQLYGGTHISKNPKIKTQVNTTNAGNVFSLDQLKTTTTIQTSTKITTEDTYLKKDLFKILTLSSFILGIQFLIFYALQINILPAWI